MPSGTITEAGKAQTLVGPDSARLGIWVQNNSDADLRLIEGGAEPSNTSGIKVAAGAYYETQPNRRAVGGWKVWGSKAGQAFDWGAY